MKFWDSSAIVPLVVEEEETDYCLRTLSEDREMLIWCLSRIEVLSALCRRLREGGISNSNFRKAKSRLSALVEGAYEVTVSNNVRERASRLIEVHPLRAADACQLASALVATGEDPSRLAMICFDRRLKNAALMEGFAVNPAMEDVEP